MIIVGTGGRTAKKILSATGFEEGSSVKTILHAKDVGTVYGAILSQTVSDSWIPDKITIKRAGFEETIIEGKG